MNTNVQLSGPLEDTWRNHSGDAWQVNIEDAQVLKEVHFNKELLIAPRIGFGK